MDKRIIKTKRLICSTLTDLLEEKDLKDITISEIANKAEVNRRTIYNYYNSVDDIISEIEDHLVYSFKILINDLGESISLKNPSLIFEKLTDVLTENYDFYNKLMKINQTTFLNNKMINTLKDTIKDILIKKDIIKTEYLDFVITYVVSGMFAVYKYWFNSESNLPLKEFSDTVSKIVYSGIEPFLK